jgi:hypothetical protein
MESNQTDIIVTACRVFSMISGGFLTVINAAAAFRFHFDGLPYAGNRIRYRYGGSCRTTYPTRRSVNDFQFLPLRTLAYLCARLFGNGG